MALSYHYNWRCHYLVGTTDCRGLREAVYMAVQDLVISEDWPVSILCGDHVLWSNSEPVSASTSLAAFAEANDIDYPRQY